MIEDEESRRRRAAQGARQDLQRDDRRTKLVDELPDDGASELRARLQGAACSFATPVFDGATEERDQGRCSSWRAPTPAGQTILFDGRTGEAVRPET